MHTWNEINTYEDLESLIENGRIKESFWVNSTEVNKLLNVREIRSGDYGTVYFKNLTEIGILETVDCDFSFFGNIKSLKNLRYV